MMLLEEIHKPRGIPKEDPALVITSRNFPYALHFPARYQTVNRENFDLRYHQRTFGSVDKLVEREQNRKGLSGGDKCGAT